MELIHIRLGGAICRMDIHGKRVNFEDHPYLGPICVDRHGEPLKEQPDADALFFEHYEAWREQGKQLHTNSVDGVNWCKYKTRLQRLREANATQRAQAQKGRL